MSVWSKQSPEEDNHGGIKHKIALLLSKGQLCRGKQAGMKYEK